MLYKVTKILPKSVRDSLSKIGVGKLLGLFYSKYGAEFSFQKGWVKEFKNNKLKVLEYWRKYRYLDEIKKVCELNEDKKILDVGCGISTVLHFVPGKKIGIDPLAEKYKEVYDYPEDINIQKSLGEEISFENESFDVVFCSNAIDHTTYPEKIIEHIHRVLKPGGFFVLR